MPLPSGTIRPVVVSPTRLRAGLRRTVSALDHWTLDAFNPRFPRDAVGRHLPRARR